MRIGIDVRYLSHGLLGGVHTYTKHLVPALIDLARPEDIYLYADTKAPFELTSLPSAVTVRLLPWRGPWSSIRHDLLLRRAMERDRIEVAHFPANYGFGPRGVATVITLHDSLNLRSLRDSVPGLRASNARTVRHILMMSYLHGITTLALPRADLVITDSGHARDEIVRYGHVDAARIVVVPLAPTPDLRPYRDADRRAALRRRYDLPARFVLADAMKNPGVLIAAWRLLPNPLRQAVQIVFFSRRPDAPPVVRDAVRAGDARLLARPPREDLVALYSEADLFVFPSWIEGFGLPALEAMAAGVPVIASNRGSLPEVVGDAAVLVEADDGPALAEHIRTLLTRPDEAGRRREAGLAWVARFSWRGTAEATLDGYRRARAFRLARTAHR